MKLSKVQEEFINLLETTDQPQGKGALCNTEGFCCLGLWTAHRGHKLKNYSADSYDALFDNDEDAWLSFELADELGLHGRRGTSITESSLAVMNDRGMPFKQIATKLRANPEYWFKEIV